MWEKTLKTMQFTLNEQDKRLLQQTTAIVIVYFLFLFAMPRMKHVGWSIICSADKHNNAKQIQ